MAKKLKESPDLANKERQAIEFINDSKYVKKGEKQLVSLEMAERFVKQKIAKKVELQEGEYEKIIRLGKI